MNTTTEIKKSFFQKIKDGIQREWERTKQERQEYIANSKGSFIKKVPNTLTRIRIFASFVIPPIAFLNPALAVGTAIGVALTDLADGIIARKCNATSKYGALLDTIADKILSLSLVCSLASIFPAYAGAILLEEAFIVGTNTVARIAGKNTKSSLLGKAKTWVLSVATISGLLAMVYPPMIHISKALLLSAILFQTVTVLDYNRIYFFSQDKKEKQVKKNANLEIASSNKMNKKEKDYQNTVQYWINEKDRILNSTEEKEQSLKKL